MKNFFSPLHAFACFTFVLLFGQPVLFATESNKTQDPPKSFAATPQLPASDLAGIRAAYEANRHAVFATENGYRARNPGQQWKTMFDGRGFLTEPNAGGGWKWGLELRSYGFDGRERVVREKTEAKAEGQRVTYAWDETVREWFVNDQRGLEHGFTINHRPSDKAAESELKIDLAVRGDLQPEISPDGTIVNFVDANGAPVVTYSALKVFDADGKTLPAQFNKLVTGHSSLVTIAVNERNARYPITIDPIAQQAYLKASNSEGVDHFGYAVAISGDTVVVGAYGEDSDATGVGGDQSDNDAGTSGAAYVFVRSGTTWTQQAYLKASNTEANDQFGIDVAISGDTIVVAAVGEDSDATGVNGDQSDNDATDSGAAYVFVRSGTTWTQQAYLKASNTETLDEFGTSVAVFGDVLVVGAQSEDSKATGINGDQSDNSELSAGAAYVFVRSGSTWTQQAYLKGSNTDAGDFFGAAAKIFGNTLVVGANGQTTGGAAYVFVTDGSTWTEQAFLKASNPDGGDQFGHAVGIFGDTIVIGADGEDSNATTINGDQNDDSAGQAGAAYIFVRNGTSWTQQAYLKAANADLQDRFGIAVGISADTVIVGAYGEASNATGVNSDHSNNAATSAGAAYVFVRHGTNWTQQAYVKASNPEAFDEFGFSVAISNDTAVVGAHQEDSNATTINGNQSNNSASAAGAAYVFTGLGPTPCVSLPANAVAWWRGDGNADDAVGGNNGSLMGGGTFANGEVNQGFNFDGTSDYVYVPDSAGVSITGSLSIDAWINPVTFGLPQTILSKYDTSSSVDVSYLLSLNDTGNIVFTVYNPPLNEVRSVTTPGIVTLGLWTHVAATFDIGTQEIKIYVNGVDTGAALSGGSTTITEIYDGDAAVRMGAYKEGPDLIAFFGGVIDEVELFNRALEAEEIAAIADAGPSGKCKCTPPPENMVSWWPGDGNPHDIKDGNDGTLQGGATYGAGKVAEAFLFDGLDDKVAVGNPTNLKFGVASNFSVDAWVYFEGLTSDPQQSGQYCEPGGCDMFIVRKGNNGDGWQLFKQASNQFWLCLGGSCSPVASTTLTSTTVVQTGVWYHVAAVIDTSEIALYVNGVKEATKPRPGFTNSDTIDFEIGQFLNGRADEVEVFNSALSAEDIAKIYNAGSAGKCRPCTPPPGSMIDWWPGDGNALDIVGNHSGTLVNGATFEAGKVAGAFSLEGDYDFVDVGDVDLSDTFTIDAWINPTSLGGDFESIISNNIGGFGGYDFLIGADGSLVGIVVTSSDELTYYKTGPGVVSSGHFQHVAMTYKDSDGDNNRFKFYVDGEPVTATVVGGFDAGGEPANDTPVSAKIGVRGDSSSFPFSGLIDELETFDRLLDPTEVAAIYNAGSGGKCKPSGPPLRQLANISARVDVGTGDNVGIAGFIVHIDPVINARGLPRAAAATKQVLIRGIGPSLTEFGAEALPDPVLDLFDSNGVKIDHNDNWEKYPDGVDNPARTAAIEATGLEPSDSKEAVLLETLNSDTPYTAILSGAGGDPTGIGLVEVYDLEPGGNTHLANLSARALIEGGDKSLIGGLIVQGNTPTRILLRGIGPSLPPSDVPNPIPNPVLELFDANGGLMETNDDWGDSPEASEIFASGLAPDNEAESAILFVPAPGNYTAIVHEKNDTPGVGLVEAYWIGP